MKQGIFEIKSNTGIAPNVFEMVLEGNVQAAEAPGQFVNIKIDGFYLRRPISVCDYDGKALTLIYKAVGKGTEKLSALQEGAKLDVLTQLGNGYDLSLAGDRPVLLGGGAGVPPLYWAAKELKKKGADVTAILGFNTSAEVFYKEKFEALGCRTFITTVDGSSGIKGFVTDALPEEYSYFYTCGPEPMLKAVYRSSKTGGEFSFEERMGCGFGACMGCSCKTITGYKRICKDGPVMKKGEILWED